MLKVLITDTLRSEGIELLKTEGIEADIRLGLSADDLRSIIADYHGLIVHSGVNLTDDLLAPAANLRVIGRAGVGLDNIDIEAATRRGIIVVNAPEGNTLSTAELTMGLIAAMCRQIPQAVMSLKRGEWDRKSFVGTELRGKILGVIGLGRIGGEVAMRAASFEMRVLAADPFCTPERAVQYGAELTDLDTLLRTAEIISLHLPLTASTRNIIGREQFGIMKPGVRIVNCARGGLIDEAALYDAIQEKIVAGAALDVFEQEPPVDNKLLQMPQVITTPHIGAATIEARTSTAIEIARNVADVLHGRPVQRAVNLPAFDTELAAGIEPYVALAERLGSTTMQLAGASAGNLRISIRGEISRHESDPFTRAVLAGFLKHVFTQPVNIVNAPIIARERSLNVTTAKSGEPEDYTSLITVSADAGDRTITVSGTLFANGEPRIVRIDGLDIDVVPTGTLLFVRNFDKPGAVSHIAGVLARYGVNIARMSVGRDKPEGNAIIVLNIDSAPSKDAYRELAAHEIVTEVRIIKV